MYFDDNEIKFEDGDLFRSGRSPIRGQYIVSIDSISPDGSGSYSECRMSQKREGDFIRAEFYRSETYSSSYLSNDEMSYRGEEYVRKEVIEVVFVPVDGSHVSSSPERIKEVHEKGLSRALYHWRKSHEALFWAEGYDAWSITLPWLIVYGEEEVPEYVEKSDFNIRRLKKGDPIEVDLIPGKMVLPPMHRAKSPAKAVASYKSSYRYIISAEQAAEIKVNALREFVESKPMQICIGEDTFYFPVRFLSYECGKLYGMAEVNGQQFPVHSEDEAYSWSLGH